MKYRYNPETCKYEPQYITGKSIVRRTITFLTAAFALALGGFIYYNQNYQSLDEQLLQQENEIAVINTSDAGDAQRLIFLLLEKLIQFSL